MGWATSFITALNDGKTVSFRPHGDSMAGTIDDGDLCVVEPAGPDAVKRGDVVLCKINGAEYLHLVKGIGHDGRVLIGNAHGHVNGWTRNVYGRCISAGGRRLSGT